MNQCIGVEKDGGELVSIPGISKLRGTITEQQIRDDYLKGRSKDRWAIEYTPDFIKYIEKHFGEPISSLYCLSSCCLPAYPPKDFVFDGNVHPDVIPLPYDSYNYAVFLINKQFVAYYKEIKKDGMLANFVGPLKPFEFIGLKEYLYTNRRLQINLAVLFDLAEEIPLK